jgi:cell division protease FtsH
VLRGEPVIKKLVDDPAPEPRRASVPSTPKPAPMPTGLGPAPQPG